MNLCYLSYNDGTVKATKKSEIKKKKKKKKKEGSTLDKRRNIIVRSKEKSELNGARYFPISELKRETFIILSVYL